MDHRYYSHHHGLCPLSSWQFPIGSSLHITNLFARTQYHPELAARDALLDYLLFSYFITGFHLWTSVTILWFCWVCRLGSPMHPLLDSGVGYADCGSLAAWLLSITLIAAIIRIESFCSAFPLKTIFLVISRN